MASKMAIVVRALDGSVIGWSPGAAQLTGFAADEMIDRSFFDLLASGDMSESTGKGTASLVPKNGQPFAVRWTRSPVHDEGGQLVGFTDMLRPLSPRTEPVAGAPLQPIERARRADDDPPETARRLRQIVDAMPLLAWAARRDGETVFLSRRWSAYTGKGDDELLGWRWLASVHDGDREQLLSAWRGAIQGQTDLKAEFRLRRHDGEYRWFECRAALVLDALGRREEWFGCNTEVHEARLAREALTQERTHLERIIAAAPGAFFSYRKELDGTISLPATSPALERMLDAKGSEMNLTIASLEFVHPDDRARVQASIDVSADTLRPWHSEHRMLTGNGVERWVEGHAVPIVEPDGAILWFGFLQDISERKQAEVSLRSAQTQLIAALEAGGMGTSQWDAADDRMRVHESLMSLFGRDAEPQSRARDLREFVLAEDLARVDAALAVLRRSTDDVAFGYRVLAPDGTLRWLSARGRGERDAAGRIERATLLHVDLTGQMRANETQLRSQKLEALGTLAGGIAHDFNNMLQAIAGNSALALRKLELQHPARPLLEAVSLASERAADLVRRILQFSRPSEQHRDVLSLRAIVSEALKLVRATVPARVEIREELGCETPFVEADATQIHQIILNLATNASHAIGQASGFLQVRLEIVQIDAGTTNAPPVAASGGFAALHVADSGAGMDADTLARIFDPFFTTKAIGEGTGLGLSVVHGIMKSLGGAVTVHSAPGAGSTFTLYFPLARAPSSPPSTPPPERSERSGGTVLFLDDERILVELGTHTLEALGYEVLAFERPREALKAFLAAPERVDAVITDLAMPELSGFDFAARLLEVNPDLPIVMISGNVGPEELAAAQRLGLRDVLIKPVGIDVLGRTLSKALRKKKQSER